MKNLNDLVRYIYKRYPFPKQWYSKIHFEKRSTEIYISEQAIMRCMEHPHDDLREVIYNYMMEIGYCSRDADSPIVRQRLTWMISTLDTLWNYLS